MSKRTDSALASDIHEAIQRIEQYSQNVSYEEFLKDTRTQDAIVRNLEIIGEAVKNLSVGFRKRHSVVEWKKLAGMRDKMIHHYFGVNWEIVWDVVREKIPGLKKHIAVSFDEEIQSE